MSMTSKTSITSISGVVFMSIIGSASSASPSAASPSSASSSSASPSSPSSDIEASLIGSALISDERGGTGCIGGGGNNGGGGGAASSPTSSNGSGCSGTCRSAILDQESDWLARPSSHAWSITAAATWSTIWRWERPGTAPPCSRRVAVTVVSRSS